MRKMFKRLSAAVVAMTMAVMCATSASAYTVKGKNWATTSGGTNGTITIRTEVYTDTYCPPQSGITVYYYGAKAYIVDSSSVKTKMSLTGTYNTMTSSSDFSLNPNLSESYNSLTESKNTYRYDSYLSMNTKTTSKDTAFGSCCYTTNGNF